MQRGGKNGGERVEWGTLPGAAMGLRHPTVTLSLTQEGWLSPSKADSAYCVLHLQVSWPLLGYGDKPWR